MTIFEALGHLFGMVGETCAAGESFAKGLHEVADTFQANAGRMASNWFSDDDEPVEATAPVAPTKPAPRRGAATA